MKLASLIALALVALPLNANESWYTNGVPASDNEWRKHDGPFKAQLFLVDNPAEIYERWNLGPKNTVSVVQLSTISDGKPFETIIFFAGCETETGSCEILGDWKVTDLNGSTLSEVNGLSAYSARGPTIENQLLISENGIGLVADSTYEGYKVDVKITDVVGKRSVSFQRSITVK